MIKVEVFRGNGILMDSTGNLLDKDLWYWCLVDEGSLLPVSDNYGGYWNREEAVEEAEAEIDLVGEDSTLKPILQADTDRLPEAVAWLLTPEDMFQYGFAMNINGSWRAICKNTLR